MSFRIPYILIACAVLAVGFAAPARAQGVDPLIEGAKLCTGHLPRYEREYGIPTHLLSAIASTESGRYHDGLKIKVPWPWTINAEGKGYFFDSKEEAIAAVRKLHAHGVQSIDVGCMQVNLYHHPEAFASLDEAFDPQANIAYAASFLRGLYNEDNSWKKAAADYHSKTPTLGNQYVGLVYDSWYQIISKLRAARLQVPESSVSAMNDLKDDSLRTELRRSATPMKVARLPEQEGRKVAAYVSPHMNSIQVARQEDRRDSARDSGLIVVRPEVKVVDDASPPPAAAQPMMAPAPAPLMQSAAMATPAATLIPVDSHPMTPAPAIQNAVQKTGPAFIFSD